MRERLVFGEEELRRSSTRCDELASQLELARANLDDARSRLDAEEEVRDLHARNHIFGVTTFWRVTTSWRVTTFGRNHHLLCNHLITDRYTPLCFVTGARVGADGERRFDEIRRGGERSFDGLLSRTFSYSPSLSLL